MKIKDIAGIICIIGLLGLIVPMIWEEFNNLLFHIVDFTTIALSLAVYLPWSPYK